ncbi:MAG: D-alanyl-D-alanine carboxypeptidase [Desulfobacteraceae bacterium]|nr:D-alanyl-D-alanine carboxypeptidase [Desulfobacteraceae bacterium]
MIQNTNFSSYAWIIAAAAAVLLLLPAPGPCGQWQRVARMIGHQDAVAVAAPGGEALYAKNAEKPLVPASTLKLLTADTALAHLGADFRFATEFYLTAENDLVIKGYGDPLLVSEQVAAIAKTLAGRINEIHDIVLDDTYFKTPIGIPGTRADSTQPYDAPIGALCVNFNTVNFKKVNNTYVSAEPQTPLLPTARRRIRGCGLESGRVLLSSRKNENLIYAGELFAYFLAEQGLKPKGKIRAGRADPQADRLVYRHSSGFLLTEVIARLMEYSSNFIANQLLVRTGAEIYGPPGTLEKGVRAVNTYARDVLGISPTVVEGSGVSRRNRMTAQMFMPLLADFAPHFSLLSEKNGIFRKTGTLDGIQTRAGYIEKKGKRYPFAVLINTPGKSAEPVVAEIASIVRGLKK